MPRPRGREARREGRGCGTPRGPEAPGPAARTPTSPACVVGGAPRPHPHPFLSEKTEPCEPNR